MARPIIGRDQPPSLNKMFREDYEQAWAGALELVKLHVDEYSPDCAAQALNDVYLADLWARKIRRYYPLGKPGSGDFRPCFS